MARHIYLRVLFHCLFLTKSHLAAVQRLHVVIVVLGHDAHQFLKRGLARIPAQHRSGLGRVAQQLLPPPTGGNTWGPPPPSTLPVDSSMPFSSTPSPSQRRLMPSSLECQRAELAHRMVLTSGYHEVLWLGLLHYQPHALHIVLGVAPVA